MNLKNWPLTEREVGDEKNKDLEKSSEKQADDFLKSYQEKQKIKREKFEISEKKIDLKIKGIISILEKEFNEGEIDIDQAKKIIEKIVNEEIFTLSYVEQIKLINNEFILGELISLKSKVSDDINVSFDTGETHGLKEYFLKYIEDNTDNEFIGYLALMKTSYFHYYMSLEMEWWDPWDLDEYKMPEGVSFKNNIINISSDYFYVDDIDSENKMFKIIPISDNSIEKVELVDLSTIFNENNINVSKDIFEVFEIIYSSKSIMNHIDSILNTNFSSLTIKEQFKFIEFLINSATKEKISRISEILNDNLHDNASITGWSKPGGNSYTEVRTKDGLLISRIVEEDGVATETWFEDKRKWNIDSELFFKSFLSTSEDPEFGENILKIGENYPPEIANLIFEKYSEFVDMTDSIQETLRDEFGIEGENKEIIKEISENILRSAKELLIKYSQGDIPDLESIKKELSETKVELNLFVSTFKTLKDCGEACALENIRSIKLEKKSGLELLKDIEVIKEMKDIYQVNYPNELGFSQEFRDSLLKGMEEKMNNDNVEFFVIKFKDEVIGFNSFEFLKDKDEIIFANFNIKKGAKGGKIGEALLEETLFEYAKNKKITALTLKDSTIYNYYIDKLGFQKFGEPFKFQSREVVNIFLDSRVGGGES